MEHGIIPRGRAWKCVWLFLWLVCSAIMKGKGSEEGNCATEHAVLLHGEGGCGDVAVFTVAVVIEMVWLRTLEDPRTL
jgi:hypothetical protein